MSNIEDVRAAERKMKELADKLRQAGARDPENLQEQLRKATDEYAQKVRELRP